MQVFLASRSIPLYTPYLHRFAFYMETLGRSVSISSHGNRLFINNLEQTTREKYSPYYLETQTDHK